VAVDETYFEKLSAASQHSLGLQGGRMNAAETAVFEDLPFHKEAARVRVWDDRGKLPGLRTPSFRDFGTVLQRVLQDR
jgi:predicted HD phosphohydrolase